METTVRRTGSPFVAAVLAGLLGPCVASGADSQPKPADKPAELVAKAAELVSKLRSRAHAVDAHLDGLLGVYVEDLSTGTTIELRADDVFPTASAIKPAVLYELYRQEQEGRLELSEVTRPALPRVPGGGVLQYLGGRVSLTWRDLGVLMMRFSDNEATNLLIRRVGLGDVNRRLDALSLGRTRLRREMMDLDAAGSSARGTRASRDQEPASLRHPAARGLAGQRGLASDPSSSVLGARPGRLADGVRPPS